MLLLRGSEVDNKKSPWSTKTKVEVLADFLPSAKVVVKKQTTELRNLLKSENLLSGSRI